MSASTNTGFFSHSPINGWWLYSDLLGLPHFPLVCYKHIYTTRVTTINFPYESVISPINHPSPFTLWPQWAGPGHGGWVGGPRPAACGPSELFTSPTAPQTEQPLLPWSCLQNEGKGLQTPWTGRRASSWVLKWEVPLGATLESPPVALAHLFQVSKSPLKLLPLLFLPSLPSALTLIPLSAPRKLRHSC